MVKNVIIVSDYAHANGGGSTVALLEAKALADKNIFVLFFSAVGPISNSIKNYKNIKVVCLFSHDILTDPSRLNAIIKGIWNINAEKRFKKILDKYDPNETVIHIHAISKALSSSVVRAAKDSGLKVIYHLHDFSIACPNMGFYNYRTNSICKLKPLGIKCLLTNCDKRSYTQKVWRVMRQIVQRQFGLLPSGINNYIAVSKFSYNIIRNYLPNKAKVALIYNPINVIKQNNFNRSVGDYFLFVGRLSREKDPITAAVAAKSIGAKIIFVGDGPLAQILKIYENCEVVGWKTQREVFRYMNNAKALIFPSIWYETHGMAVSEAEANGVPAIVSDVSAAQDFVTNDVTGNIFKAGDAGNLSLIMKKYLNDQYAVKMSKNCYENYWQNPLTLTRHIESLINYYNNTLDFHT